MMVVVSADAKIFHVAGCEFIHNKDKMRTLTAKEAMHEGYVPCVRCMRKYLETAKSGHTELGIGGECRCRWRCDDDRTHEWDQRLWLAE